jgi:hypothetical protein
MLHRIFYDCEVETMPFKPSPQARSRYRRRAIPLLIAGTAIHFLVPYFFAHTTPSKPVAFLVASLQPLFLLLLFTLIMQFLNSDRDEVQLAFRRHAMAWATAGTLAVCVLWSGLAEYKMAPDESLGAALPIFSVALLMALLALRRRYQ